MPTANCHAGIDMSAYIAPWVREGREPSYAEVQQYLVGAIARSFGSELQTREQIAKNLAAQVDQYLEAIRLAPIIDEPVSAGWLRECGIPVPDSIPDCATVPRSSMKMRMAGWRADGDMLTMDMRVTFDERFKWFEATVIVDDGHDGSEI
jgi:hypothetical protein